MSRSNGKIGWKKGVVESFHPSSVGQLTVKRDKGAEQFQVLVQEPILLLLGEEWPFAVQFFQFRVAPNTKGCIQRG